MDLSVAIPTYNGAKRLQLVLNALQAQKDTESISWEIIVVDNNSDDDTRKVVEGYQAEWARPYPLKYCFEERQGAGFARIKAVKEAEGKLIGFLDDDCVPEVNWVFEALRFALNHPKAGIWGSRIFPKFEADPPKDFVRIAKHFAISAPDEDQEKILKAQILQLPPSAGLVCRKNSWVESVPGEPTLTGKAKSVFPQHMQGEDDEISLHIFKVGWEIWYNPKMRVFHYIPQERLTKKYILPLVRANGLALYSLRSVLAKAWEKPVIFFKIFLGFSYRALLLLLRYRRQAFSDLVTRSELEFFISGAISPFWSILHKSAKKPAGSAYLDNR